MSGGSESGPPRLARRLLELLLPRDEGPRLLDELDELHARRVRAGRGGSIWYWRQALRYLIHLPRLHRGAAGRGGGRGRGGDARRAGPDRPLRGLGRDVRFALRGMRRSPTLALTIVTTLALGLGATFTVFALVDGIFLRPVPVAEPDRVVAVFQAGDEGGLQAHVSYPTFSDLEGADVPALEGLAGHMTMDVGLRWGEVTDRISAGFVTGDYFRLLGVGAAVGRPLLPSDDREGAPLVAVLGHGFWTRTFGRDPSVVGRTVELNGHPVEIVGVAPDGFRGTTLESAPRIWLPLHRIRDVAAGGLYASSNLFRIRAFPWIRPVGRLRRGATPADAEAQLGRVALSLRSELGDASAVPDVERPVRARRLAGAAVTRNREGMIRFVGLLGAVVLLALVVACANAAMLVSARMWSRTWELGVRRALGAGRWRLVRQLLTENVVLALVGGALGLGLAAVGLRLLGGFTLPGEISLARVDLSLDAGVVAAALGLSLAVAVAFGLWPAVSRTGRGAFRKLQGGRRGATDAGSERSGTLLVAAQVGLSLVLLVGALLFTRTLRSAFDARLGFEPDGVAALSFAFRGHGYADEEIPGALDRILAAARSAPGIASAAVARQVPLAPPAVAFRPVPRGAGEEWSGSRIATNVVTPGFFETLRIPVVEGRAFGPDDGPGSEDVAVVSRAAAALLWPGEDPLGRRFVLLRGLDPVRVVGVVEDHKLESVEEASTPALYLSAYQSPGLGIATDAQLVARGEEGAGHALGALRRVMREFDPGLPVFDARRVADQLDRVLMPQRLGALILGLLSALTLVISAVGVYGMVTFVVRRRTRELGIRVALGAGPGRVLLHAVGRAGAGVGAGLVGGLILAGFTTRFLEGYLVGVQPLDGVSFAGAALLLSVAAGVAAVLPARRALRADPRRAIESDGG